MMRQGIWIACALVAMPVARGQFGANIAASIGSAAGKRISDQINNSLRQGSRAFSTGKAKDGKSGGGAKSATANVPPPPAPKPPAPPPLQRVIAAKKTTAPSWMTAREPLGPPAPPPPPLNVDLAQIQQGMTRETLLAFGKPTSKLTLYEDGHMVEVYQYRNQSVPSGTVRLRDGAVATVEARP